MSATSCTSPSTGLSGNRFSTLNSADINDPEGSEKNNHTEVKYGATFCNEPYLEVKLYEVIKERVFALQSM
jgi:hypothetical protein